MRMRRYAIAALTVVCAMLTAADAVAQIQRHPTGVNVNANGPTTVFITYGNLQGMIPVEGTWCGEVVSAAPDIGDRCDPATIFGNLPERYFLGRASGQDGFTDIMSIPQSVARRAYQAAEAGSSSAFFYVRRFIDPDGLRPDEFVSVTCRMTGGGARVPFSLIDVQIAFDTEEPVGSFESGEMPPPIKASITYNGTGRLKGRWEVVLPGEEPPTDEDLLTEATLPVELRGTQRRYTEIARFNEFLPPTGEFELQGPDPESLPTDLHGLYLILLRIEAGDDKEGESNLEAAGAGAGVVRSAAVAGFPMPPLRYYVGGGIEAEAAAFRLLEPREGATLPATGPLPFHWTRVDAAALYRIEFENGERDRVLEAFLEPGVTAYGAPDWLRDRLPTPNLRWRVSALDAAGDVIATTPWRGNVIENP